MQTRNAVPVAIGLGSNVGDSWRMMQRAIDALAEVILIDSVSRPVTSSPMYVIDQPQFLNAALIGETNLPPIPLLKNLKRIEARLGRQSRGRYGPREIDLDILLYGALTYRYSGGDMDLEIPHPRLFERRFMLLPLAELAELAKIPGGDRIKEWLTATDNTSDTVEYIGDATFSIPGR